ncbi:MAG TPA: glutamyl-tRNA reductase [Dehalococcoidia bacterium]|nr:glutamyl-tRNA reductase [Dehalococcoidia bacterium]
MHITLVGISHKTAPVAVREHFAFAPAELPGLLQRLGERYAGAAVLSTCNRTEVYVAGPRVVGDPRPIEALLSQIKGDAPMEGAPFFALSGKEAARHLFRVASGIDSMVVGESEILGQVRASFNAATAAGTHTPALSRLFHSALRAGRRVRTQTEIGRRSVSVSSTAVHLARDVLGDLAGKTALVVSAGEAGKLTARSLAGSGVSRMLVTTRNPDRAAGLAAELHGEPVPFAQLAAAIAEADIVISSSAAPAFLIDRPLVEGAMRARPARPLLLIDIAVPRDVDPAVRGLPAVHLHDIDDLQAVARHNMHLRRAEMAQAEAIVDEEVAKFGDWLRSLEVLPTVAALRTRAEAVRAAEIERTLAKTTMSAADRKRVEAMTAALVKKLLHDPITRLKTPGDGERYVEATRALFALDDPDHDA